MFTYFILHRGLTFIVRANNNLHAIEELRALYRSASLIHLAPRS